ncbi:MAG: sel1 repeat family protein [Akkermansiaceae bacterium]|nr:sel1 repeat family protein [Akkermansia sp.]MCD7798069.1 sel1 repeat family protein [Akkermansiaceae bacterium]MCD8070088.1 sel1 repeat family protein [Akkermansiaceae bacterium]
MNTTTLLTLAAILGISTAMADTSTSATPTSAMKNGTPSYQYGDSEWADVETITVQAANGDPIAQYVIAWILDEGAGVPQDTEAADTWYKKAAPGLKTKADQGDATACRALSAMYKDGKGVSKDEAKATELAAKAAHNEKK